MGARVVGNPAGFVTELACLTDGDGVFSALHLPRSILMSSLYSDPIRSSTRGPQGAPLELVR
jgi:hypothetical protein